MEALAVLARLARQTLDEERRALAQVDDAIGAARTLLIEAREAAAQERRSACALADDDARLLAYLRRPHDRAAGLEAELRCLERQREAQTARLSERHLELRRLEIMLERRAERARIEDARRDQKTLELALLRGRRRAGS